MKRHVSNDISVLPGSKPELDTTRDTTISYHNVHTEGTRSDELVNLALGKCRIQGARLRLRIVSYRKCGIIRLSWTCSIARALLTL